MAKRYIDIEELQEDNNKDIFFDKQYDESRYDIITELGKQEGANGSDGIQKLCPSAFGKIRSERKSRERSRMRY